MLNQCQHHWYWQYSGSRKTYRIKLAKSSTIFNECMENCSGLPPLRDLDDESSESEDVDDYKPGGYHAVRVGDLLDGRRYKVLRKLGWGQFSTVWLCLDKANSRRCAVKIQKAEYNYMEAAKDEIKLLSAINKLRSNRASIPIVRLLDHFQENGPNGVHVCMCFEELGMSLVSLMKRFDFRGIPVNLVRVIARQILQGLVFIHEQCKIIHTDLKPENVLLATVEADRANWGQLASRSARDDQEQMRVTSPFVDKTFSTPHGVCDCRCRTLFDTYSDEEGSTLEKNKELTQTYDDGICSHVKIKIVDFGNACWDSEHVCDEIQTRQYRCPEVILGARYSQKADVWSFACMAFELLTGDFLFDPTQETNCSCDENHLALMIQLLGNVPADLRRSGAHSPRFFEETGELRRVKGIRHRGLQDVLVEKYCFSPEVAEQICCFLLPLLHLDPIERLSAYQALQHPFVRDIEMFG